MKKKKRRVNNCLWNAVSTDCFAYVIWSSILLMRLRALGGKRTNLVWRRTAISPPDLGADDTPRTRKLGRALGLGASGDWLFGVCRISSVGSLVESQCSWDVLRGCLCLRCKCRAVNGVLYWMHLIVRLNWQSREDCLFSTTSQFKCSPANWVG